MDQHARWCCCCAMFILFLVPAAWIAAAQDVPRSDQPIESQNTDSAIVPYRGFYNSVVMISRPSLFGGNTDPYSSDRPVMDVVPTVLRGNSSNPKAMLWPTDLESAKAYDKERELLLREAGCRVACKEHGHCDNVTQFCICDYFWTQNPFVTYYDHYATNCNWNVFVVIGVLIGIAGGLILLSVLCHVCCRRTKKQGPYRRYRLLPDDEYEEWAAAGVGAGTGIPKRVRAQLVDSDDDSETVFEAKNPKYYAQNQYGTNDIGKSKPK